MRVWGCSAGFRNRNPCSSVRCGMSGVLDVLSFPIAGSAARTKATVDHSKSDEALLVRRVQAGDEMAFREIVERYQSKIYSIIYGILRNHNDAEDIAQQVFAKVYFSIRNFDFRSSLLTWIYKITVNECYDYLRKKKVRKLVYESDFSEDDALKMENCDAAVEQSGPIDERLANRDLVTKLLAKIPEQDRSLLMLKEVEGHSVEELAQMTGMNENTIKVKLFRARQKLLKSAQRLLRIPARSV
ncbi:MAG: sigma-70 family RNA polymerase sigma factor [Acidobacteria bacterium]|nr:sigma-70 family RNA polymerase sigma factor [Acidobacteriota bacterium]